MLFQPLILLQFSNATNEQIMPFENEQKETSADFEKSIKIEYTSKKKGPLLNQKHGNIG